MQSLQNASTPPEMISSRSVLRAIRPALKIFLQKQRRRIGNLYSRNYSMSSYVGVVITGNSRLFPTIKIALIDRESQKPLVADFGLALHEDEQRHHRDQISGSPAYMAPEMVRGESHRLDGRADIWSSGVILYELLTGRNPFAGETIDELFDEIQHREPKPPRMIDNSIPAELERITLRCLCKNVTDRYNTAADLAGDLRDWLEGKSTHQTPILRSHSQTYLLAGGLVVVMAVIAFIGFGFLSLEKQTNIGPETNASNQSSLDATNLEPLDGSIDVLIWNDVDQERQRLSLSDPTALPMRSGDSIQVKAELNRPAYVYLLWIGTDGTVSPVYPWEPGKWSRLSGSPKPVSRISLPVQVDGAWPMEGPAGMETLVLPARDTPLPQEINIRKLLPDLPRQPLQHEQTVVWLDRGVVSEDVDRAPKFFDVKRIDDPVLTAQRILTERLGGDFPLIRAVSFAKREIADSPE